MSNFKYHVATIIGIFLALAVGILIGSSSSEEVIIRYQRDAIAGLEAKNTALSQQIKDASEELDGLAATSGVMQDLLNQLARWYWLANPLPQQVVLIHGGAGFSAQELNDSLLAGLISSQINITFPGGEGLAVQVADLLLSGDAERLARMEDMVTVTGEILRPDVVLLAPGPKGEGQEVFAQLAHQFLDEGVQVIAVGKSEWGSLEKLINHQLFSSVSHLDTPFGFWSLLALIQGAAGHFGPENLLPEGLWE